MINKDILKIDVKWLGVALKVCRGVAQV